MLQDKFWWNPQDNVFLVTGGGNTGKSHVLVQMMVEAMAPQEYGGRDHHVIFIESRMNVNPRRFLRRLEDLVRVGDVSMAEERVSEVAKQILIEKLLIKRVYSMEELTCHEFLESMFTHRQPNLLVLDCLSSFYWAHCAQVEPIKKLKYAKGIFGAFYQTCLAHKVPFVAGLRIDEDIDLEVDKVHMEVVKDKHGKVAYRAKVCQGKSEKMFGLRIDDLGLHWTKPLPVPVATMGPPE